MLSRALAFAACAVLLAGCNGGTVDRHALTNDAASVDSMACEGALLAHDVAHGKTTCLQQIIETPEGAYRPLL